MTQEAEVTSEFPRSRESCVASNEKAFSVEARFVAKGSKEVCGQVFTDDWQRLHFEDGGPVGVPANRGKFELASSYFGLMSYQAAQALRWWFHAVLESTFSDSCFETRIIEHRIKYSIEQEAVAAHDVRGNSDNLDKSARTRHSGTIVVS